MKRLLGAFRQILTVAFMGGSLCACSSWQLNENTLDVGGSVGDLYRNQVLTNLYQPP